MQSFALRPEDKHHNKLAILREKIEITFIDKATELHLQKIRCHGFKAQREVVEYLRAGGQCHEGKQPLPAAIATPVANSGSVPERRHRDLSIGLAIE